MPSFRNRKKDITYDSVDWTDVKDSTIKSLAWSQVKIGSKMDSWIDKHGQDLGKIRISDVLTKESESVVIAEKDAQIEAQKLAFAKVLNLDVDSEEFAAAYEKAMAEVSK